MNIQGNSDNIPRSQEHPVPLVWTYQFREFAVTGNIYFWPLLLNYFVCAHGAYKNIPNEYPKEHLWYSTIPTAPYSNDVDIPVLRICCDMRLLFLTLSWIFIIMRMILTKCPKWISKGTPLISHDPNDTVLPWRGHASFENLTTENIYF